MNHRNELNLKQSDFCVLMASLIDESCVLKIIRRKLTNMNLILNQKPIILYVSINDDVERIVLQKYFQTSLI